MKIYEHIVLPRILYACELWTDLTVNEMRMLESAHRYCIKYIQGFHPRTRTDICLPMVGCANIEAYIDKKKLLFLRRLIVSPFTSRVRDLAFYRCSSTLLLDNTTGFFKNILGILEKYNLLEYLQNFMQSGTFPTKGCWKNIVKSRISTVQQQLWLDRIDNNSEFRRFKKIHKELFKTCNIWNAAMLFPEILHKFAFLARLCTLVPKSIQVDPYKCKHCQMQIYDELEHFFLHV